MKKLTLIFFFVLSFSLMAQRYQPAKIIFKDSTSRTGLIKRIKYGDSFNPISFTNKIVFKESNRATREFLDTKQIDRIILFDNAMDVEAIFDYVQIKGFNVFKKNYPLSKWVKTKLLPLLFETKKYRVYRYEVWENNQYQRTFYYLRNKNDKYAYPFYFEDKVVLTSPYIFLIRLFQVRAMQEFGRDCPEFLDYLKPLFHKFKTVKGKERKRIAKEYKKLKKSFESRQEFELHILGAFLKKYEELCGEKNPSSDDQINNSKQDK